MRAPRKRSRAKGSKVANPGSHGSLTDFMTRKYVELDAAEKRRLLDMVSDVSAPLSYADLTKLAHLHRTSSLNPGFLVRIAEKFGRLVFPNDMRRCVKDFLLSCQAEKLAWYTSGIVGAGVSCVEQRVYVERIKQLAGLDRREIRYFDQRHGYGHFTETTQAELARQERLSEAAITKRFQKINRKLLAARYLTEVTPEERRQLLQP
jgi:hypothetical protein